MSLVVDASVIVKWLLQDATREDDTAQATALMQQVLVDGAGIMQPVHWLAEVAAVPARLNPTRAKDDVLMLRALELPVDDSPEVWHRACRLAAELDQHLFDALYHAVALEREDAVLVTADARYARAARARGQVLSLSDWTPG
jgi:predicted nucleic acid-binding protein